MEKCGSLFHSSECVCFQAIWHANALYHCAVCHHYMVSRSDWKRLHFPFVTEVSFCLRQGNQYKWFWWHLYWQNQWFGSMLRQLSGVCFSRLSLGTHMCLSWLYELLLWNSPICWQRVLSGMYCRYAHYAYCQMWMFRIGGQVPPSLPTIGSGIQ